MGIKRLKSFVKYNFRKWETVNLRNSPVVVDGNSFLPYIMDSAGLDLQWRYGGQYLSLEKKLQVFFSALREQNINPIYFVFDGVHPKDKIDTVLKRKEARQRKAIGLIESGDNGYITPPLAPWTLHKFLEEYNHAHGNLIKIFTAEEEADQLCAMIANAYNCPLLGDDSDYYICALQAGYAPLSEMDWGKPGDPITLQVYHRHLFARELHAHLNPEMLVAIPAIVGNDCLPNLIAETSLKCLRGGNKDCGDNDLQVAIDYLKRHVTQKAIVQNLYADHGEAILYKYYENMHNAQEMYENIPGKKICEQQFTEKTKFSFIKADYCFPDWMVKQHTHSKFSSGLLGLIVTGCYFHKVIPDNYNEESVKIFSRPIRQEIYGMLKVQKNVHELVRVGKRLDYQSVKPAEPDLSVDKMNTYPEDTRITKLCCLLKCAPESLSSLDHEWYLPVASVCYWAKHRDASACFPRNDLKVKAMLLCFAECYLIRSTDSPTCHYDLATLHLLNQWQCTYIDAVTLNQVLALPLPYISPAFLFDGRRICFYLQRGEAALAESLQKDSSVRRLFNLLLEAVNYNI